jgi:DNA-binding GntR family transcriptional regulator
MYNVKFQISNFEMLSDLHHPLGLNDQVYDLLKNAITQHKLPAGSRLEVNILAERWQVSRTPVNDAIQRLMAEGLVSVVPRRGTFVASLDVNDILELMDARLMFELRAAELVAGRMNTERLKQMKDRLLALDELLCEPSVNITRYSALDLEFHFLPISWMKNGKIQKMYQAQNFQWYMTRLRRSNAGQAEHWKIYQAYECGTLEAVKKALTDHVEAGKASVLAASAGAASLDTSSHSTS